MTQISYFWDGTALGDAEGAPYHLSNEEEVSPFVDIFLRALFNGDEDRGVLNNWANELEVTAPGAVSPAVVDTGAALVYGLPYFNTAGVNVTVPTPASDTRIDRIVVRRDWADQEARITRIAGVEGGAAPAIIQSPAPEGTGFYDIPLAQVSITTGGVITLTDEREYCAFSLDPVDGVMATANIQADAVDDLTKFETRDKSAYVAGGDLEPCLTSCGSTCYCHYAPAWGPVDTIECWQFPYPAVAYTYRALNGTWYKPLDMVVPSYAEWLAAGGDDVIDVYVWWIADAGATYTFTLRHYAYGWAGVGSTIGVSINEAKAAGEVTREHLGGIYSYWPGYREHYRFSVYTLHTSTVGPMAGILGVEYVYAGYR